MLLIQYLERIALTLPPIDQVIEALDAHEFDSERRGVEIPRDAVRFVRPLLDAAFVFQKAVLDNAQRERAIDAANRAVGGIKIDGEL